MTERPPDVDLATLRLVTGIQPYMSGASDALLNERLRGIVREMMRSDETDRAERKSEE